MVKKITVDIDSETKKFISQDMLKKEVSEDNELDVKSDDLYTQFYNARTGYEEDNISIIKTINEIVNEDERIMYNVFTRKISEHILKSNEKSDLGYKILSSINETIRVLNKLDDESIDKNKESIFKILVKLIDHVNLAIIQFSSIEKTDARLKEARKEREDSNEEMRRNFEKLESLEAELRNSKSEMLMQLISMIAIFTGLTFLIFGGIQSVNGINDIMMSPNTQLELKIIAIDLWCILLFNLIIFFMYFISKLLDKNILTGSLLYVFIFFDIFMLLIIIGCIISLVC